MTINQLRQQQLAGFRWLRFQPDLETRYREIRDPGIRERARPVSACALALFLIYALLDWAMLPQDLARDTVFIRLLITSPIISLVWWLSWRPLRPGVFLALYSLAYLAGGLSVIAIIGIARLAQFPLPYEGILLILMFGYFAMGLPFRLVSALSLVLVLTYLAMEYLTGMPVGELAINGFFILTANIIGMVGSWLSEHRQRAHFLDHQMLQALRYQAETESERKTSLITVASHDLRQPLNVISLILENLSTSNLPDEQAALIMRLKTSVAHFNELLASVLDISRLQEGMVKPEPEALLPGQVLAQLEKTCQERARSLNIELALHDSSKPVAAVLADPQLLHRILQNLVFNALDHSGASRIDISVHHHNDQVTFSVSDNGKGIDPQTRDRIFDPFFRTQRSTDPGLGLGLAIVRELSGLMNGICWLESTIGQGACFKVRLPSCVTNHADSTGRAPSFPSGSPHLGLILVEDHDESRYWMHRILSSWNYQVYSFASAEEALDHSTGLTNALLITDLHLPGIQGDQLFRELTERQSISGGVLVTADSTRPAGYNPSQRLWIIHKPLQPMRLRAALQQLLRR